LKTLELKWHDAGILVMSFDRPRQRNTVTPECFSEWKRVMEFVHDTATVRVLVITGKGHVYCSGYDIEASGSYDSQDDEHKDLYRQCEVIRKLTELIITSPVPIIAAVNGPALGYGCTTLALFDIVISVDSAVFSTPFTRVGLCAEGCSSVTFPRVLGHSIANEMLLLGKNMGAKEMHQRGFVSKLVQSNNLLPEAFAIASKFLDRAQNSIRTSRALIRSKEYTERLLATNDREMDEVYKRVISSEAKQAIARTLAHMKNKHAKPKL
ncbi:hypothetical protein GGI15_004470, partial [Coemansia interrupta]